MHNIFFTYEGNEYIIIYEDNEIKILKKDDNELISLKEKEYKKIIELLNNNYGYIYNEDLLTESIKNNNQVENKSYVLQFLRWLEKVIPEDCRDNLYNNAKTLQTTLHLNLNFEEQNLDVEEKNMTFAGYNTRENKVTISKESLLMLWQIANETSNPEKFYWEEYGKNLMHELLHMASSKYDTKTKTSLCGFDKFPTNNEEEKNRGLTEGLTEIIAMSGILGTFELSSCYYIEVCLITQLTQIIGIDVFEKSYFSNLGISPIKEKLQEVINDPKKSFELFRNIELNFQIRNINEKQNVLGNIQLSILDYLEQKLKLLNDNNQINEILENYEHLLITPQLLDYLLKKPENYIGIEDSINKFKMIEKKYKKETINSKKQIRK